MNISNNVSSIQSHQKMMDVNANNIANVNTDGFIPKSTTISNTANSVTANIKSVDDNGSQKSQTNLAKDLTQQIVVEDVTALNITAIKTQDNMMGTLLDIKA